MKLIGVLLFAIVFLTLNSAHSEDLKKPSQIDKPRIVDKTKENPGTTDSYKNPPTSKHKETHIISDIQKKTECINPDQSTPEEKLVFTPIEPFVFHNGKKTVSKIGFKLQTKDGSLQYITRWVLNKPVQLRCTTNRSNVSLEDAPYSQCHLTTDETIIYVAVEEIDDTIDFFHYRELIRSALINSKLFTVCVNPVDGPEISNKPSQKQNRKNNSRGLASEEIP